MEHGLGEPEPPPILHPSHSVAHLQSQFRVCGPEHGRPSVRPPAVLMAPLMLNSNETRYHCGGRTEKSRNTHRRTHATSSSSQRLEKLVVGRFGRLGRLGAELGLVDAHLVRLKMVGLVFGMQPSFHSVWLALFLHFLILASPTSLIRATMAISRRTETNIGS